MRFDTTVLISLYHAVCWSDKEVWGIRCCGVSIPCSDTKAGNTFSFILSFSFAEFSQYAPVPAALMLNVSSEHKLLLGYLLEMMMAMLGLVENTAA